MPLPLGRRTARSRETMPPRHRFLEPIHNVKEGLRPGPRPEPRNACLHAWKILAAAARFATEAGGAYRDRTDDLKLAKLALSQLS
jgi:hypothetical protein